MVTEEITRDRIADISRRPFSNKIDRQSRPWLKRTILPIRYWPIEINHLPVWYCARYRP